MKLKIFAGFIFLIFGFFLSINSASAASNYSLNTNPDVPQDFHTYTQSVFIEIAAAVSCQLTGYDPTSPKGRCLGIDPKTNKIGFVEGGGGAIGMMSSLIAGTFNIPVSTHNYGAYMASSFGIAKRTYASGSNLIPSNKPTNSGVPETSLGYNELSPTIGLWRVFRNITYLVFVILFVVIGLGIMFRIKIDPRTVMTIQNQIPKIIIAIVFVTLSYAIAGFLVDLMYVSIYLIVSIFYQQGVDPSGVLASSPFGAVGGFGGVTSISLFGGHGGIAEGVAKSISGIVSSMFDGTLGNVVGGVVGAILGMGASKGIGGLLKEGSKFAGIGSGWGTVISGLVGAGVGALFGSKTISLAAGVISYLVVVVAIFSALIRLWFALIKAYIYVLITVVFAPMYIAYGLIPGKSGFGNWIRSMVANLAVFPVTITMFLLGRAFTQAFAQCTDPLIQCTSAQTPFAPPLVGDFTQPERFASIIGLGIILLTPEVVNIVRDALKAPEFKYATSIGKSVGVGAGVVTAGPRQAWSGLMRQPRWAGDPGGPLFTALSGIQQGGGALSKLLTIAGFHGSGTAAGGHGPS